MKSVAALVGLLLALVLPTLTAPPAYAHAVLVASDPVDGSTLTVAPARVRLVFDEPVRMVPHAVQVISSSGAKVDLGAKLLSGNTVVELLLPGQLPRDSYTAMWRLISADGHEVSGSVSFGVGQGPTAPPIASTGDTAFAVSAGIARGARYAGLVLCVGVLGVCAMLWTWALTRRRTLALAGVGWLLLVTATVLDYLDTGAGRLLHTQTALVVLLAIAAAALVRGSRVGPAAFGVVATALAVSIAADGHSTDSPLAIAATTAHLLAMAIWLGGLCVLTVIVLPARRSDGLQRWSQLAFGCVAAVILTGEYQAWRQLFPVESLWHTDYGITLCVKLFLVSAMVGLAYFGRRRLTTDRLRRTVPLEAAVAALVLLVTTVLTGQAPARTTFGPPLHTTAPLEAGRAVSVDLATTRHGAIPIDVTVSGAPAMTVRGTLSSAEIASLPVHFTAAADGHWRSSYASAPRPGLWTLQLTVQFSGSDAAVTSVPFRAW